MDTKILSDKEIEELNDACIDFSWLVNTLKKIILNAETPITIGIYGNWGSGKTSIMRVTKRSLEGESKTIWFNAWKYDKVYDLRVALIKTILKKMEEDSSIAQKAQKFSKKVDWLGIARVLTSVVIGAPSIIAKEDILHQDELISIISEFDDEFNQLVTGYVKDKPLVIFIDDLDRCLPEKVIDILEAIKLFLDAEKCVFVIGINKKIIEDGVKIKYKGIYINGDDYIEKIIQLPFNLQELREEDTLDFIRKIAPEEIKKYDYIMSNIGGNPRRIKRMVNKFLSQMIIIEENQGIPVDKEILAKLSVIELRWNKFYNNMTDSYEKDLRNSRLLLELKNLILATDEFKIKEKLENNNDLKIFYYDKSLIAFLDQKPLIWDIDLEPYIYLKKATMSPKISDYPDPSEIGNSITQNYDDDFSVQ